MSGPKLKIRSAFLCDDLRTEFNGKHIVIGIYGPKIGVPSFPSPVKFRVAIIVDVPEAATYDFKVRVVGPSKENKIEASLGLRTIEAGNNVLLPGFEVAFPVTEAGIMSIEYFVDEWETIGFWQVNQVDMERMPQDPNSLIA